MKRALIGLGTAFLICTFAAGALQASADSLLEQYYLIQKSLASDSTAGVSAAAAQIESRSRQEASKQTQSKAQLLALAQAAAKLKAADLKAVRNSFGELSERMISLLQTTGAKRNPPYQLYCPMAKKNWLQTDKAVRNPYYGSSMLTCGELVNPGSASGTSHH